MEMLTTAKAIEVDKNQLVVGGKVVLIKDFKQFEIVEYLHDKDELIGNVFYDEKAWIVLVRERRARRILRSRKPVYRDYKTEEGQAELKRLGFTLKRDHMRQYALWNTKDTDNLKWYTL